MASTPVAGDVLGGPGGARFAHLERLVAPAALRTGLHVVNTQLQEMLAEPWLRYLAAAFDGDRDAALATLWPNIRELRYRFDSEVLPHETLRCGVRCLGRSTRTFTLHEVLWHDDGRVAVDVRRVIVAVDPARGAAIPVDPAFWARLEAFEGRLLGDADARG